MVLIYHLSIKTRWLPALTRGPHLQQWCLQPPPNLQSIPRAQQFFVTTMCEFVYVRILENLHPYQCNVTRQKQQQQLERKSATDKYVLLFTHRCNRLYHCTNQVCTLRSRNNFHSDVGKAKAVEHCRGYVVTIY